MGELAAEVIIVGAGAAGLAAAWRLHGRGRDVLVLEAAPRAGGVVGTVRPAPGWLFERGPYSLRAEATHVRALIRALGLRHDVIEAEPAAKTRYIWRHGALHPGPGVARDLMRSDLLTARGKLRLLSEPLQRRERRGDPGDETVASLLRRRIGDEALRGLVDPIVSGIFAGDPAHLGVDAWPVLRDAEGEHGSLFSALMARRGRAGAPGGVFGLRGGLGQIPDAIADLLGERLRLDTPVARVESDGDGVTVHTEAGDALRARHAVIATPGGWLPALLGRAPEELGFLRALPAPFVATVGLGWRREDVAHDLAGFGALMASDSPLPSGLGRVMGVIFASAIFAGRAPAGHHALSVLIGGMHDPSAGDLTDAEAVARATGAVAAIFGAKGPPVVTTLTRWPRAIPQYQPGHARAVRRLLGSLSPSLRVAGSWIDGVSLDAAVASGMRAADSLS